MPNDLVFFPRRDLWLLIFFVGTCLKALRRFLSWSSLNFAIKYQVISPSGLHLEIVTKLRGCPWLSNVRGWQFLGRFSARSQL